MTAITVLSAAGEPQILRLRSSYAGAELRMTDSCADDIVLTTDH